MKRLAVGHNQFVVLSVHTLEPKARIEILKDRPVLLDNRLSHHHKQRRWHSEILTKPDKHLRREFIQRTQRHVRHQNLVAVDLDITPRRVRENKRMEVVRRAEPEQFRRQGFAVWYVVEFDRVPSVHDVRGLFTRRPKSEWVCMDPRRVTRIDAVLDNHLSRLFDGCFEPHRVKLGVFHVGHLGWLWSFQPLGTNPQESILILLVKVNLKQLGTIIRPRFTQLFLGVFPAVVRTLYRPVSENLATGQRRTSMTTRVRCDVHFILVIPPDDVVTFGKSYFTRLGSECRCARQSDPALHTFNTLDIFKAHILEKLSLVVNNKF